MSQVKNSILEMQDNTLIYQVAHIQGIRNGQQPTNTANRQNHFIKIHKDTNIRDAKTTRYIRYAQMQNLILRMQDSTVHINIDHVQLISIEVVDFLST